MKRVLVIGSGGAGKSTLANRLSRILKIEVTHLDALYWQPGWVETPKAEWRETVEQLIAGDSWILDGNYSGTLDIRIPAADTVIFLDLSPWVCLWRVLKRIAIYRNQKRPDMAEGCNEKFDLKFIAWIWNYQKRTKPKIVEMLTRFTDNRNVIQLRSPHEVERFLTDLQNTRQSFS